MGNCEADSLSTVSLETNIGDYSKLPDCMIIDPPETLPEEIFDVRELWNLEPPSPETYQPICLTSTPVASTAGDPLVDVTNIISPEKLAEAGEAATTLAAVAGLTSTVSVTSVAATTDTPTAAGGGEGEVSEGKKKARGKKKKTFDSDGKEIVPEKKPRVSKKAKTPTLTQKEPKTEPIVTTVPLAVGYGALNLWVRSLDR